ncbi:MAG: cation diffusion facilitator family transporter [Helicobacteraceae bacterium]|nr:cation diffusion facilitator family transporter [Helicobacteraceae bacterium]
MKAKKLLLIIFFNLIIIVAEIVFGFISNSFALIADALHNTGDVIAIIITFIALKLGSANSSFKYTFGFLKAEMMAAFTNTLFLFLTMFYMIYEAINRLFNPEVIEPLYMIVVGTIAVVANGISAYILNNMGVDHCSSHEHSHHQHEDANIKSAYLHMLSDALISVGVVVAGIFIYYFKIYYIDSILTVIFSFYILSHSYPLLKKSFLSLMDVNIVDISEQKLNEIILNSSSEVLNYYHLHINKPSSKHNFISFHLILKRSNITLKEFESVVEAIRENLESIGFNHIIIQPHCEQNYEVKLNCDLNTKVDPHE